MTDDAVIVRVVGPGAPPGDFARYAAACNADPVHHCGYVGVEPDTVATEFANLAGDHMFAAARTGGRLCGLVCVEWHPDAGRAWLYGPWADTPELMDRLYEAARPHIPAGARNSAVIRQEVYCDEANVGVAAFALRHGFTHTGGQVIMRFGRDRLPTVPKASYPALARAQVEEFVALHDGTFVGTRPNAATLLAGAGPILAAVEGGRLVGYLALTLRPEVGEARINYLAVAGEARRRGTGAGLVRAALHRVFADPRFDAVDLVTNTPAAERLYVGLGFTVVRRLNLFRR